MAGFPQLLHPFRSARAQIVEPAEHDRFGRANFGGSRNESAFLSIVTKRAFECATGIGQWLRPAIDYAKWAGDDAVTATVANIVLDEDRSYFRPHDRPSRARFETTRFITMFANVGQENPAERIFRLRIARQTHRTGDLIPLLSILLEEHDVAPGRCAEEAVVVVGLSRPDES